MAYFVPAQQLQQMPEKSPLSGIQGIVTKAYRQENKPATSKYPGVKQDIVLAIDGVAYRVTVFDSDPIDPGPIINQTMQIVAGPNGKGEIGGIKLSAPWQGVGQITVSSNAIITINGQQPPPGQTPTAPANAPAQQTFQPATQQQFQPQQAPVQQPAFQPQQQPQAQRPAPQQAAGPMKWGHFIPQYEQVEEMGLRSALKLAAATQGEMATLCGGWTPDAIVAMAHHILIEGNRRGCPVPERVVPQAPQQRQVAPPPVQQQFQAPQSPYPDPGAQPADDDLPF